MLHEGGKRKKLRYYVGYSLVRKPKERKGIGMGVKVGKRFVSLIIS